MKTLRKHRDDLRKKRTMKSLRSEIEDLKHLIEIRDAEIDSLKTKVSGLSEQLEVSQSKCFIKDQEIDNLNQVVVRDRKRVEAEAQIAQMRIERDQE